MDTAPFDDANHGGEGQDGAAASVVAALGESSLPIATPVFTVVADVSSNFPKKRKFVHTNEAQRRAMIEWLELPGNFELLVTPSGSKHVNGKKIKKTDGFRALMHHVNTHTHANWTMDITKSRFESFLTSYKKIKRQSQEPAFAVTENDRARGLTDVAQKRNALCLFYDRIDALYEHKPIIPDNNTAMTLDAVNGEVIVSAPSGGDEAVVSVQVEESMTSTLENEDGEIGSVDMETHETNIQPPHDDQGPSTDAAALAPSSTDALSDDIAQQQLVLERKRLDLLAEQLAMQRREFEVKERELQQQEDEKRRILRAELAVKLAEAGKSVDEIRELLAVIITN